MSEVTESEALWYLREYVDDHYDGDENIYKAMKKAEEDFAVKTRMIDSLSAAGVQLKAQLKRERELTDELINSAIEIHWVYAKEGGDPKFQRQKDAVKAIHSEREGK